MKIEKTHYNNSDCYRCAIHEQAVVIAASYGPRILCLALDGKRNIFYVDERLENRIGEFVLYGGHRLWIAPQTDNTHRPDNHPCEVELTVDSIKVIHFDPVLKIEKSILIEERNGRFIITHCLTNRGDAMYLGSCWALTCMKPGGTAFFPWSTEGAWKNKKIVYFQEFMGGYRTNIRSAQFIQGDDLFIIKPNGEVGKVGTAGYGGFIGYASKDENYTFIKKFHRFPSNNYPDDNCAIECYTCESFIELETLGPLMELMPGVTCTHSEEWYLLGMYIDPLNGDEIRRVIF